MQQKGKIKSHDQNVLNYYSNEQTVKAWTQATKDGKKYTYIVKSKKINRNQNILNKNLDWN